MRSLPIGFVVLLLLAALQATLFPHFNWVRGYPELVLVAVLTWSLVSDGIEGLGWAVLGGFFLDTLSGAPFGIATLGLLVVSVLAGLTEGRLWESHLLLPLGAVAVGTLVYQLLYLGLLALTGWPTNLFDALAGATLPSMALNLILMLPAYRLARWLNLQLNPPGVEI